MEVLLDSFYFWVWIVRRMRCLIRRMEDLVRILVNRDEPASWITAVVGSSQPLRFKTLATKSRSFNIG